jgi:signal transduction histidine kinase/CheY-like chemotaxis protein
MREAATACPEGRFRAYHLPELTTTLSVAAKRESARVADRLREEIVRMSEDGELGGILANYSYLGLSEMRTMLHLTAVQKQSRQLAFALTGLGVAMAALVWLAWHLRRARRFADQANAAKSEFLAKMSHEIRTPLGGVMGMIELSLDTPLSPVQKDYLETAHSSAQSLLAILNDILDFSKIEARKLELAPAEIELRELVGDVARLMAPQARNKGLAFETTVAGSVPSRVYLDPVRVKQVLLNLVGNALKFTESGEVRVNVDYRAGDAPALLFQVTDTGIGIDGETHSQLFEPFVQGDDSTGRRFGGSGLGLAISRQLVEMMGGEIWFESSADQGSAFSFSIPVKTAAGAAAVTNSATQVVAGEDRAAPAPHSEREIMKTTETAATESTATGTRPIRILVAEDNRINQKLIRILLEREGHSVTMVASGDAAVKVVETSPPFDLILMDIQMPEMDGFQATAAIRMREQRRSSVGRRCDETCPRVPIIALTAHAQVGYQEVCLKAGMDSYLTKPIDQQTLRRVVADFATPVTGTVQPGR